MYDSAEYANNRLHGSIVRLISTGKPIKIQGCEGRKGNIKVSYTFLNTGRGGEITSLSNINLSPVSLGWADHGSRDSSYLVRIPKRSDWRQGLRSANYMSLYGCDKRYIKDSSLTRTILGQYLSFALAADEACNSNKITAYCRDFAIKTRRKDEELDLYFKWFGKVGDIVNGEGQLSPHFGHLQETLEESM